MVGTAVPEAAIDEHGDPPTDECNVGSPANARKRQQAVDPIATHAPAPQFSAESQLRARIPPQRHGLHLAADDFR